MTIHRLHLTPDQAAFLRERGSHFIAVTRGSYPTNPGGFNLYLIECDTKSASDALDVATGKATARRPKN